MDRIEAGGSSGGPQSPDRALTWTAKNDRLCYWECLLWNQLIPIRTNLFSVLLFEVWLAREGETGKARIEERWRIGITVSADLKGSPCSLFSSGLPCGQQAQRQKSIVTHQKLQHKTYNALKLQHGDTEVALIRGCTDIWCKPSQQLLKVFPLEDVVRAKMLHCRAASGVVNILRYASRASSLLIPEMVYSALSQWDKKRHYIIEFLGTPTSLKIYPGSQDASASARIDLRVTIHACTFSLPWLIRLA
ncbi:hypothetical protein MKW98_006889 [Papaver atlanticum]|uniref:Uncharacterized protein n=1 Tax=Papaver atlanticum TaxID=357466 RepID=A0AAD4SU64_9MAGN|nr:hypothetical protein MKW98_006889 [Papaver atlanticum]